MYLTCARSQALLDGIATPLQSVFDAPPESGFTEALVLTDGAGRGIQWRTKSAVQSMLQHPPVPLMHITLVCVGDEDDGEECLVRLAGESQHVTVKGYVERGMRVATRLCLRAALTDVTCRANVGCFQVRRQRG